MSKKKEIIKRLVESKAITFDEALILLEVEKEYITKKEYVTVPSYPHYPYYYHPMDYIS